MDRRHFLTTVATTAVIAGGGTFAAEELRPRDPVAHGRAVKKGAIHANPTMAALVWRVDTERQAVAITFDDGPDPRYTPLILATLKEYDAVATFFMQGSHVEDHPDLAREVAERHAIGNHSFTHPDMGAAKADTARRELTDTHKIIESVVGRPPVAFRPPYGNISGATTLVAADLGYDIILWSKRISSRSTIEDNYERARDMEPGDVVVAHDGGKLPNRTVVASLPGVLEELAGRSLQFVTIPDLLSGN